MGSEEVAFSIPGQTFHADHGSLSLVPDLSDAAAHLDAGFGGEGPEELNGLFAMQQHLQAHLDRAHHSGQRRATRNDGIGREDPWSPPFVDEIQVVCRSRPDPQGVEHGVLGGPGLSGGRKFESDEI